MGIGHCWALLHAAEIFRVRMLCHLQNVDVFVGADNHSHKVHSHLAGETTSYP